MKKIVIILAIMVCIMPVAAQKRAFAIADIYRLKGIADPQVSPDGRKIAFVVTEYNLEKGKSNADVYVMNIDGNGIVNLTDNPGPDNNPRWSPDGKTLLFLSSRENGQQAWKIDPNGGGKPERITNFAMGVSDAEWSPDGKNIIFSADVFADCGANNDCNKLTDSAQSNGPVQAHVTDKLLYRHWTDWKEGKQTHTFIYNIDSKTYTDLTPGNYDAPAWEQGGVGFVFSPDGKEVCFVSDHSKIEAASTNKDLWIVSSSGGGGKKYHHR